MFARLTVLGGLLCVVSTNAPSHAGAIALAHWTFETSAQGNALVQNDSMSSPNALAEGGVFAASSTASGLHASAATDWSSPVGNGSAFSFSVNTWAVGDHWQFTSSTSGYQNIMITWDQTGSGTGPRDFTLQYSINGTDYFDLMDYSLLVSNWTSGGSPNEDHRRSFDLSSISAVNDISAIYFRLTMRNTTNINGATVGTGGTNRIDNIIISGDLIPTPGVLALLGLAGVAGRSRRRR